MFKKIINSAFPIASSLITGIFGNRQQSKYISQQERANNIAFERNKQLAQYQNQLNIDAWHMNNQYNSPRAQMARLRDAGINPDLYYGGTSGLTASNSPTMSGGTPISPADYTLGGNRKTIGDIFNQSFQNSLLGAQTRKENADAKGQEITNETLFEQNFLQLQKTLSEIGVNNETINKIKVDVQAIYKQFDVWTAQIDKLRADIANDTERVAIQKLEYEINKKLADQNIKESLSRIGLNNAQIKSITQKLPIELVNLTKQGQLTQAQINESVSRWMLNILEEEKVIAETDKILLENIILNPQALQAQTLTKVLEEKIGNWNAGADLYWTLNEVYRFMNAVSGLIPGSKGGYSQR